MKSFQSISDCFFLFIEYSDNLSYRLATVVIEPFVHTVDNLYGYGRVDEVGCSYLYRRSTGHKELYGILGCTDTSESYNGYFDRLSNLPNHT